MISQAFDSSLAISSADAETVLAYVTPQGLLTTATSFPPWANNALAYVANVPGGDDGGDDGVPGDAGGNDGCRAAPGGGCRRVSGADAVTRHWNCSTAS